MYSPAVVEYLGTSLLLAAVSFGGSPLIVIAAVSIAVALGGKISGGYFNPAVTVWAFLSGKIGQAKAVSYVLAQLGAAVTIWMMGSFIKV